MIPASLMESANEGEAESQYKVGIAYCLGEDVPVDYKVAAEWFRKAADQDFIPAKRELGIMHLTGEGAEIDPKKAFELLDAAAGAMDPNAMYHLALMYERGIGVEKDLYMAVKYLAYAASVEYPGADEDADRIYSMIVEKRTADLRSRPVLNLEISDVDVMAACCKKMYDAMMNEDVVVMDSFSGPQLVGEDKEGNDFVIEKCPWCGKPLRRVPRDKQY